MRPSQDNPRRQQGFLRPAALLASLGVVAVVLLRFPPSLYTFYPRCPIDTLLHLQCPGCGATRALAALLHGNVREALAWNALTTCALPFTTLYAIYRFFQPSPHQATYSLAASSRLRWTALAVVTVFAIARNL